MKLWIEAAFIVAAYVTCALSVAHAEETVIYYHTDALGSVVAVTDANGNVIERSEYEPYGALLNRPLTDGPGYTGHVSDAQTGLSYMQQRYYDPMIGRFLSRDPVRADANTGANFNPYWYANNNPYRFVDPDGRETRELTYIYRQSGATPPVIENAPNLVSWGATEFLCGFCDLNYVAPGGSGALQPIVTPFETATATGAAVVGKVVVKAMSDPKALFLAGSLITGDTDVAEALAAAASRKAESELVTHTMAQAPKASPPPPPKPPTTPPPPAPKPPPPPKKTPEIP